MAQPMIFAIPPHGRSTGLRFGFGLRALYLMFLVTLLCSATDKPVMARGENVYIVAKVRIDSHAENAVIAKKQALAAGPLTALKQMFRKLAPFKAYDRLPLLTHQDAEELIDGFSVRSERNSSTRYIASLDYTFSRAKMQEFMTSKGIPFFDRRSKKQVIIPVMRPQETAGEGSADQKTWWRSWQRIDMKHGLTDTKLYKPKKADQEAWQKISSGETQTYATLKDRYAINKLILVEAGFDQSRSKLSLRLYGEDHIGRLDYTQELSLYENTERTYKMASQIAYGILEGRWREPQIEGEVVVIATPDQQNAPSAASARLVDETVFMRVLFTGLRDWRAIRKKLQRIPGVQKMRVNSLSPRGAEVRMTYPGGFTRLRSQMSSYGFALETKGKEHYLSALR